ncbi:MAG: glycogen/starch synthase [Deinococcales bacterium]|nr:glycogen/starch synthase [Chitinophagaceae bacterium]
MSKKRILFIATEMSPYLELTEFAGMVNRLAIKSNDTGLEVRCIMPRFGVINERRHRLHEVVRLSGINVSVDNDDYPLQIKVASLPNARLQVYFLENEDFFKRKQIFHDEDETWFDDNGLRTIFFCKGALETVKKFGWAPDVVHCSGWMSSLVPAYIKTAYKREPVFGNSKIVFTVGENTFEEKLSSDFIKKALINANIKEKDLDTAKELDNTALFRVGATHADAITFGSDMVEQKLIDEFAKAKGKKIVGFKGLDTDLSEYMDLYNSLSI